MSNRKQVKLAVEPMTAERARAALKLNPLFFSDATAWHLVAECCARCGLQVDLNWHHKRAVGDGGSDDQENLIRLCAECHREWHHVESKSLPIEAWAHTPSALFLTYAFVHFVIEPAACAITVGDLCSRWMDLVARRRADAIKRSAKDRG